MPFSDDEQMPGEEKSGIKNSLLVMSIGLYCLSFFFTAFCTSYGCRYPIEVLLVGWLAMSTGGAAITWLANPLLVITWILLMKNKRPARFFALAALAASVSFPAFRQIIDSEAGHYNEIQKLGSGYWLWMSSCFTACVASFQVMLSKHR